MSKSHRRPTWPENRTAVLEPSPEVLRQLLKRVRPIGSNVFFTHRMEIGDPAKEIVRVASEEHVDMIVMSTRGRTGLTHALMGSVAEKVVRKAACPVFIVKQSPSDIETNVRTV